MLYSSLLLLSSAMVGDHWRVVTWPTPVVESYMRDYTEPSGTTSSPRPFTISGNFFDGRVHDVDFDTSGNLYATTTSANGGIYQVDDSTGAMTLIAPMTGLPEGDMAYDPTFPPKGRLVVVSTLFGTSSATQIDLSNNAVTTLWTATGHDNLDGIAFDSNGAGFVVDTHPNTSGIAEMFTFADSGLTSLGSMGIGFGPAIGMDFNGAGQLHILANGGRLYHVVGTTATIVDNVTNPDGHTYKGLAFVPVCVDRPTGMVAWYTGDDTTPSDFLGQHDGAFVGSPLSAFNWKVGGGALEVHSPDTYVIVPDSSGVLSFGNPTDNFSIDAWVNVDPANSSGIRPIADKRLQQGPNVFGYDFYLFNGFLGFQMADGPFTNYVSNTYVADGLWHLVAVTVARTGLPEVVLYVDGQIVFSGAPRTGNANNSADLWIGSGHPISVAQPYTTGLIDELELFNRALTPTDILNIFQADYAGKCKCTEPPSDMVAWWPLDETLACDGCPVEDIVAGLNNGFQACTVTPGPGEVSGAFRMTGQGYPGFSCSRGYVVAPPGPSPGLGAGSFTIDAWIQPDPCTSCFPSNILCHPRPIVSNRAGVGGDTDQTGFIFFIAGPAPSGPVWSPLYSQPTPGWLGISLPPPTGTTPQMIFSSSNPVVDNVWQHVAVTVDPSVSSVTFFYNGTAVGSSIPYAPVSVASPHPVSLGHAPSRGPVGDCNNGCGVERYFNGSLDEIEVFNRALLPSEIAAIYLAGPHGKCKPDLLHDTSSGVMTNVRAWDIGNVNGQGGGGGVCEEGMTSFCFPNAGGTRSCPCGNQPSPNDGTRGCNNFGKTPPASGDSSTATGGAILTASGSVVSNTSNTLVFHVTREHPTPSGNITLLLMGSTTLSPGVISGAGVRCVGGLLIPRPYKGQSVFDGGSPGTCNIDFPNGSLPPPYNQDAWTRSGSPSGVMRHYYAAYRNTAAGNNHAPCDAAAAFNLTNAGSIFWP